MLPKVPINIGPNGQVHGKGWQKGEGPRGAVNFGSSCCHALPLFGRGRTKMRGDREKSSALLCVVEGALSVFFGITYSFIQRQDLTNIDGVSIMY